MGMLWETKKELDEYFAEHTDVETGEFLGNADELSYLYDNMEQATEDFACYIVNENAEIKAIEDQEKILRERKAALKKKVENHKSFLGYVLGGQKIKSGRVSVSYRKSKETKWKAEDEDDIIGWMLENLPDAVTTKTEVSISKSACKEFIEAGNEIPGVTVEEKQNLIIK